MTRVALGLLLFAGAAVAHDVSLDAEVERYLEQTAPVAREMRTTWANRIRFESADGDFRLDLIGWLLWDNIWADSDDYATSNSTRFRSVRLGAQGYAYRNTVYKIQLEFANGVVGVRDVFVGLRNLGSIGASVIAGHCKEPFGLEFLNPLSALFFMERSAPTRAFVPDRNSGILLSSSEAYNFGPRAPGDGWFHNRVAWAIGVFRTGDDRGRSVGNGGTCVTFRVSAAIVEDPETNTVLHFAFAGTLRNDDRVRYIADAGLVDTGELAVNRSNRIGLEAVYIRGGFSVTVEWFGTSDDLEGGPTTNFQGGYVSIGTWVTGDRQAWNIDRVPTTAPRRNFRDGQGGAGGVWIGYRFDLLDLNDGAVRGGAQQAHTLGVNWAWNWNTRFMFNYRFIDVDSGPEGAGTLHFVSVRVQFNF